MRALQAVEVRDVRTHDVHHCCVSVLLELGRSANGDADVGHSGLEMTMAVYAHAPLEEAGGRGAATG